MKALIQSVEREVEGALDRGFLTEGRLKMINEKIFQSEEMQSKILVIRHYLQPPLDPFAAIKLAESQRRTAVVDLIR